MAGGGYSGRISAQQGERSPVILLLHVSCHHQGFIDQTLGIMHRSMKTQGDVISRHSDLSLDEALMDQREI